MSVKRYEWVACDEHSCHCDVVESAEGDMVDYEDYAELEARCSALAAENAGLKVANAEGCKWDGEQWVGISIETPVTDAFLAEVRAQGEEMFAASLKVAGGHEQYSKTSARIFPADENNPVGKNARFGWWRASARR